MRVFGAAPRERWGRVCDPAAFPGVRVVEVPWSAAGERGEEVLWSAAGEEVVRWRDVPELEDESDADSDVSDVSESEGPSFRTEADEEDDIHELLVDGRAGGTVGQFGRETVLHMARDSLARDFILVEA